MMRYALALAAVWATTTISGCLAEGDYFLLVSRFTIHGLWPENYDGSWPQYCSQEPFSKAGVQDLLPVLRREWPSVFSRDSKFWSHEWHRHGTCAETLCPLLTNEHAFFFAVLALNKMYDLNAAAKASKVPLNTPITQEWLEDEFSDAFGHRLAVRCGYPHGSDPVPLREVWMCLDSQMQPFDCPDNIYQSCESELYLPTISDSVAEDVPENALNPGQYVGPHGPHQTSSGTPHHSLHTIHELVFGERGGDM